MHVHMYVCLPSSPCRFVCMYIDRRTDGHTSYSVSFVRVKSLNLTIRESIRMKSGVVEKNCMFSKATRSHGRTDARMDGKETRWRIKIIVEISLQIHPHLPYIPRYSQVRAHVIHLMACSYNNNSNKRGTQILSFMRKGKWWNHEFGGQFAVISGRGTRVMKWWSTYSQGSAQNRYIAPSIWRWNMQPMKIVDSIVESEGSK